MVLIRRVMRRTHRCKVCLPKLYGTDGRCSVNIEQPIRCSISISESVCQLRRDSERDIGRRHGRASTASTASSSSNCRLFHCDRTTRHLTAMKNAVAVRESIRRWVMSSRVEHTIRQQWCYLQPTPISTYLNCNSQSSQAMQTGSSPL